MFFFLLGIMTLQRRLSGMERDLAAIQAKLDALDKEAEKIGLDHPEEEALIRERTGQIRTVWDDLTQMLKERDAKLEEAGDLHRFLRDLDHFQTWLTKTQTDVASEDIPASLAEAEKLLSQHQGNIVWFSSNALWPELCLTWMEFWRYSRRDRQLHGRLLAHDGIRRAYHCRGIDVRRPTVHVLARAAQGPARWMGRIAPDVGESTTASVAITQSADVLTRRQTGRSPARSPRTRPLQGNDSDRQFANDQPIEWIYNQRDSSLTEN